MKISQFRKYVIDSHYEDEDEYDSGESENPKERKFIQKAYSYLYNEYKIDNYSEIALWLMVELGIPFSKSEINYSYKYCSEKILQYIYNKKVMQTEWQ